MAAGVGVGVGTSVTGVAAYEVRGVRLVVDRAAIGAESTARSYAHTSRIGTWRPPKSATAEARRRCQGVAEAGRVEGDLLLLGDATAAGQQLEELDFGDGADTL